MWNSLDLHCVSLIQNLYGKRSLWMLLKNRGSLSHIYRPSYTHTCTHKHTHIHSNFWEAEIVGFSISLSTQRDRHALGRLASFYGSDDFNWFPSSFFSSYHIHLEQNKCYYFKIDWNRLSRVLKNVYLWSLMDGMFITNFDMVN